MVCGEIWIFPTHVRNLTNCSWFILLQAVQHERGPRKLNDANKLRNILPKCLQKLKKHSHSPCNSHSPHPIQVCMSNSSRPNESENLLFKYTAVNKSIFNPQHGLFLQFNTMYNKCYQIILSHQLSSEALADNIKTGFNNGNSTLVCVPFD